jgi:4-hydroxy-4-methyl-2-oxoglutarate aldolase
VSGATIAQKLCALGVATVYEAAGRTGLIEADLIQVIPGSRAAGPARIARVGQNDNRAVHEAMDTLVMGDILVISMPNPQPIGVIGELLVTQAHVHGAAGILVDAAARDIDDLREIGLPIWSRWIRAAGATKNERGELDVAVEFGGVRIEPGDIVVMDTDGAVVVPRDRADEVLAASQERFDRESAMRVRLQAGELSYDIHGLRANDSSV